MTTILKCLFAVGIALFAISFWMGCTTTASGEKKFDQCKALSVALDSHKMAEGASSLVCTFIKDPAKRAKCFEYRKRAAATGSLILNLGASVLKACGLGGT